MVLSHSRPSRSLAQQVNAIRAIETGSNTSINDCCVCALLNSALNTQEFVMRMVLNTLGFTWHSNADLPGAATVRLVSRSFRFQTVKERESSHSDMI